MSIKKRLTDINKWKPGFFQKLPPAYKLLWGFINDDCDHAGIWDVDIEIAQIRVGLKINIEEALSLFKDHIHVFDNGSKWYLKDFIQIQYTKLSKCKPGHDSAVEILKQHDFLSMLPKGVYDPLIWGVLPESCKDLPNALPTPCQRPANRKRKKEKRRVGKGLMNMIRMSS